MDTHHPLSVRRAEAPGDGGSVRGQRRRRLVRHRPIGRGGDGGVDGGWKTHAMSSPHEGGDEQTSREGMQWRVERREQARREERIERERYEEERGEV